MELGAGPLSVSFSCEGMGVELSTEGPLKGFVSFDTSWEGQMTVYAGAKAEIEGMGPLPGLTMSDGIYITGDKSGVTDVGGRVAFETFKEVGGVKVKATLLPSSATVGRVMEQAIENGGSEHLVVEDLAPVGKALVARDDQAAALVAARDQLKEQMRAAPLER